MRDPLHRLYDTKTTLMCVLLVAGGVVLIWLDQGLERRSGLRAVALVPWAEFGGTLVAAGLLSIWLDRFLSREQRAIEDQRLRALLREQAPAMRDAVIEAFGAGTEDLKRVATPELLDRIITNSLALRLEDTQFASEVYDDLRDQAIRAAERWYDAKLSIELAPLSTEPSSRSKRPPSDLLSVTVRWEYSTVPKHPVRRFVCVSDRAEYLDLAHDRGATSAWYLKPRPELDASEPEAFQLLRFAVNGAERPIRRTTRKGSQLYSASIGPHHLAAGEPVTVAYTYRTITSMNGNLLFFEVEQPTRDLSIDFDFTASELESVSTLDLIPTARPIIVERSPSGTTNRSVRVSVDGWIFPRSGVAFVWRSVRN